MQKTRELLAKANHIFDKTLDATTIAASALMIFLMIAITVDIILRYFFNRPTPWMLEVTSFSLLWITFLGVAWLLRKDGHVKMELLLTRLNPRSQTMLNIITSIIIVIVCVILVWQTAENTAHYIRTSHVQPSERRFPTAPIFIIVPIGLLLLLIQSLRRTNGYLKVWRELPDQEQRSPDETINSTKL